MANNFEAAAFALQCAFPKNKILMYYTRLPNRGGNWNNGGNAGLFNLNLNNPRSNSNWNIGGRSALHHVTLCAATPRWIWGL